MNASDLERLNGLVLGKSLKHVRARRSRKRSTYVRLRMFDQPGEILLVPGQGWELTACMINTIRKRPVVERVSLRRVDRTSVVFFADRSGYHICEFVVRETAKFPQAPSLTLKEVPFDGEA